MYAISLTSIPPRLPKLGPVLASLLAQRPAPAHVFLCLPERWDRFETPHELPAFPDGVTVLRTKQDLGPATKALVAARWLGAQDISLLYCDDDWIYPQGWAKALLAIKRPGFAVAATGYCVGRLGRRSKPIGDVDIAQGYSGVLIDPKYFQLPDIDPAPAAWLVDDIWLSGQLAQQGVGILLTNHARDGLEPAYNDSHALQATVVNGRDRHDANLACLDLLNKRYALWPPS